MVMIRAGTLSGTGTITANGGIGVVPLNDGSGGGGAGGSVLLTAQTWSPTSLTVNAVGGAGANNWIAQPPGTPGEFTPGGANNRHGPGGGGGGVILLSSATNTATNVNGGAAGDTTDPLVVWNFGAQPGSAGVVSTTVTPAQVTTGISGVLCLPTLTATKTTSTPGPMTVPNTATYTITVSNAADRGVAIGASISDVLPSGFTYASDSNPVYAGGASGPPTISNSGTLGTPVFGVPGGDATNSFTIPGGGSVSITFIVNIGAGVPPGTYQNPARVDYTDPTRTTNGQTVTPGAAYASGGGTAGGSNYDPASSTGEDVQIVAQAADLSLTKTVDNATPNVGSNVTFTLTIANAGPNNASNVAVSDLLPAGLTYVSSTPSQGSYVSGTGIWTVGSINSGANATLGIVATVTTPGAKNNYTQVSASDQADPDSTPNDGSTTDDDDDTVTVTPQAADLSLTKTVDNATPNVGANVTFTLTVANAGPNNATNVAVRDVLPAGLTYVSSTPSQGSYVSGTGIWTVGSINSGANATLGIVATVTTPGAKNNYTQVSASDQADPDSTPNDGSTTDDDDDTVTVTPQAATISDPAVTKTGNPPTASVGDIVTFTIVVTNNGTANADNVTLTDPIPAFLDIVNVTVVPTAGATVSIVGNTVTVSFGTLTPGETYTVTITTVVNSLGAPPGGTNMATVTTTSADADPNNNASAALVTIVTATGEPAPATGFAPDQTTILPAQPNESAYLDIGDLWIEIPSLGVKTPVVGVPLTPEGWDVTWLGSQAGYLNGTAFPTWEGNSVLTAHVTLASGRAGPFRNLKNLRWDNTIIVHYAGQRYVYSVRSTSAVRANDTSIFRHEERAWVTLVTCGGYDARLGEYRYRIVVKAVLTSIEAEP